MRSRQLLCVAVVAALAGCANLEVGRPIDSAQVATIVPGRSTKDSVKATFGVPLHVINGPGGEIWVYRHLDGKRQQDLTVSFNADVVCVFTSE
jgi:hypothetical protein